VKARRSKQAPPLDSPNWLPIHDAVGSLCRLTSNRRLAVRDLTAKLASGDVRSMRRCFVYGRRSGTGEGVLLGPDRELLPPSFYADHELDSWSDHTWVVARDRSGLFDRYFVYYGWKPDLEKIWPSVFAPTPTARGSGDMPPPQRRVGALVKHQWQAIDAEIARRCIDPKTGRVKVPKSERKLAEAMLDWCQDTYGREPAESEMRDAVKAVGAALRAAQTGRK
jgi:hypothetical protein